MTAATVLRPLAPSEQIFAFAEVFVGYSARVSGRLDPGALAVAFEAVLRAHPMLGARLAPVDDLGHVLLAPDGDAPAMTVVDGVPEQLLTGADPDQRRAACALCVVRDGATASVTLLTHHSIADAVHSLSIFAELWRCYREAAAGRVPVLPERPYPASVEGLLAARGIVKRPVSGAVRTPAPSVPTSAADDPYPALITTRCRLSKAATAALIDLGHRSGVTVHGLVSAALLLTEAATRGVPVDRLHYAYSVDLRRRLRPPVGPTEATNVLGYTSYRADPGTEPSLVGLARGICGALRAGLDSGFIQQTPLQIPEMPATPHGTVIATNWGRIPPLVTPDGLRVIDFRSTMIAKRDRTGRRLPQPGGGTTIISTFDDQLSVEVHHPPPFRDEQLPRLAGIGALLNAATE
ncbi:phthiocerol/phthiodiolone dimycocerosyl transferase family protein [Nocardia cyriacigeorgica]|uniref:phthiocerol/phthiodiolone dimycocerosyl transferase family protein n=1 Tax=Nocardia cyriacigeorgica TaxID=135487 RepID=UPI001893B275|nr:acyltransferase [Nocardia cyriacigeorgica]MBF6428293.1 acyltransferase [Nocardia cyriacigeorgica]